MTTPYFRFGGYMQATGGGTDRAASSSYGGRSSSSGSSSSSSQNNNQNKIRDTKAEEESFEKELAKQQV